MENNETDKAIFEIILFFTQLETMIKNHNILMKDKILEGDLVSASIAFNNALIISGMQKIIKENPIIEKYSKTDEFKNRLNSLINPTQEKDKNLVN
jgi:hypothetical protein